MVQQGCKKRCCHTDNGYSHVNALGSCGILLHSVRLGSAQPGLRDEPVCTHTHAIPSGLWTLASFVFSLSHIPPFAPAFSSLYCDFHIMADRKEASIAQKYEKQRQVMQDTFSRQKEQIKKVAPVWSCRPTQCLFSLSLAR